MGYGVLGLEKHNKWNPSKVALEAVREVATVAGLAAKYQIHPSLIHTWMRQLMENQARFRPHLGGRRFIHT